MMYYISDIKELSWFSKARTPPPFEVDLDVDLDKGHETKMKVYIGFPYCRSMERV